VQAAKLAFVSNCATKYAVTNVSIYIYIYIEVCGGVQEVGVHFGSKEKP
jgi:hypothetical protein